MSKWTRAAGALIGLCFLFLPAFFMTPRAGAAVPQSRITGSINDGLLTKLSRNTHPLAQAQYDQGVAPADLPMNRMILVLTRSASRQTALETMLRNQQDPSSQQYHQWLTPQQFGEQFGSEKFVESKKLKNLRETRG